MLFRSISAMPHIGRRKHAVPGQCLLHREVVVPRRRRLQIAVERGDGERSGGAAGQRGARVIHTHVGDRDERLERRVAAGEDVIQQTHAGGEFAGARADHLAIFFLLFQRVFLLQVNYHTHLIMNTLLL